MILSGTDISVTDGKPDKTIFIIAKTYRRYEVWCWEHGITPKARNVVYVRNASDFRGVVKAWYADLGTTFDQALWVYNMLEVYTQNRGFKEIP